MAGKMQKGFFSKMGFNIPVKDAERGNSGGAGAESEVCILELWLLQNIQKKLVREWRRNLTLGVPAVELSRLRTRLVSMWIQVGSLASLSRLNKGPALLWL